MTWYSLIPSPPKTLEIYIPRHSVCSVTTLFGWIAVSQPPIYKHFLCTMNIYLGFQTSWDSLPHLPTLLTNTTLIKKVFHNYILPCKNQTTGLKLKQILLMCIIYLCLTLTQEYLISVFGCGQVVIFLTIAMIWEDCILLVRRKRHGGIF